MTLPSGTADRVTTLPGGENLMALPTRLISVCTTRSASATTCPEAASTSTTIPAPPASTCTWSWAAASRLATSWAPICIGIDPDSMRSMSRISLIRRVSRSLLSNAISTILVAGGASSPSAPPARSPSEPRIAVSGVFSSWLTNETNSFFIRSTSRRRVTSRNTTTTPRTLDASPRGSAIGLALTSTGTSRPSLLRYASSIPVIASPLRWMVRR